MLGLLADGLRLWPDSFHSPHFALYNSTGSPPWRCLTLVFPDRCLDLVALTDSQAAEWFFGLQALIPLNPSFKSKPIYRWHTLKLKVQYYAKQHDVSVAKYCRTLITRARKQLLQKQNHTTAGAAAGRDSSRQSHV